MFASQKTRRLPSAAAAAAVFLLGASTALADAPSSGFPLPADHPGAAIYDKLCVDCHAETGRGVPNKADDPLQGNRDIASLAGRIERTMPEDEEDLCVSTDAKAVAEFIYHAFYSVEARARNTPARIELSRLTVEQHRNSIADLLLGFTGKIGIGEERGLKAQYYGGYKFNDREDYRKAKKKDQFEKRTAQVKFDFGEAIPPEPEAAEFSKEGYSIRWSGSILAEETGTHEFVVRTRNGATLWVNEGDEHDSKTIDAWVAPDNEIREVRGSAFLIGGRPYPIILEFFKYKEKAASVELLWKPPHGVLQTIPKRNLSPDRQRESLVVSTPFPADDRSVGYERGTAVSKTWIDAVNASAIEAAEYVVNHLDVFTKTKSDQAFEERAKKIGAFGVEFADRAFRRPLSEEQRKRFVDRHFDEAETLELAVKRLVLATLTSPRFLYPDLGAASNPTSDKDSSMPDQWTIASRLALNLWDSLPDDRLRDRASKGHLAKPQQIEAEAERMILDWRSQAKMRGFFHHWLELERADDLAKDKKVYPDFNEALLADLRTSLNLFLDQVVWHGDSSYRDLLLADYLYLNPRLGPLYGKPDLKGGFQKVAIEKQRRSGIITHPFLLTAFAYHNNTSPIHRGVFLTRNIVGMTLKSPPMANEFKDSDFDPNLTMREKVTELTRSKACMACHVTINPLGFSLEHYDGIGRWRWKDHQKPVDSKSEFKTDTGNTIKIAGARDVATYAADSPSAHRAFVQQLFHHTVKQPVAAYDLDRLDKLRDEFEAHNFSIRHLLKRIAITAATDGKL